MPNLSKLRSGLGAGFALFKKMWRRVPEPGPGRLERYLASDDVDFTDFRQRLINALQFRQPARAVLQNPFVSPPPHATIIDKTGLLSITFDDEVYRFADYATNDLVYTCPPDHLAVIRFWGFTGIYSADEFDVNDVYQHVVFSLLDDDAQQIQPYVNQYRPGPAEAICLNAMIPVKPGHQIVPVVVGSEDYDDEKSLTVLARLWGWHWPHGEPGPV